MIGARPQRDPPTRVGERLDEVDYVVALPQCVGLATLTGRTSSA